MKTPARFSLVLAGFVALIAQAPGQIDAPPSLIDYQGQLLNSIGGPLTGAGGPGTMGTPANFEIRFRLWDAQTGGTLIWAEKQIVTVDKDGFFSVRLGEGEAITVAGGDPLPLSGTIPNGAGALLTAFDGNERFLGVTVIKLPDTPGEIQPRLKFLSSPFALVAEKARFAEFGPSGGVFAADQIGVGTTTPTSLLHLAGTGSVNLLLEADSDNSNESDQPSLTFSQDGGAQLTSLGYFGDSDHFSIQTAGNVGIGTDTPSEDLHVVRPDNDIAKIYATGTNTGGGMVFVGQSEAFGGGFLYEGDGTPAVPGGSDRTVFFRRNNFTDTEVMSYAWNTNHVKFNGNIGIGVTSPTEALQLGSSRDILLGAGGDLKLTAQSGSGAIANWTPGILFINPTTNTTRAQIYNHSTFHRLHISSTDNTLSPGVVLHNNNNSWSTWSDERLKSDLEPLTGILKKIENIRVVGYNIASVNVDKATGKPIIDRRRPPRQTNSGKLIKHEIGSIAQDWMGGFPELVHEPQSEDDYYFLDYDRIGIVAIGAAQELNRKVKAQEEALKERDAKIADLETRLARLETVLLKSQKVAPPVEKRR